MSSRISTVPIDPDAGIPDLIRRLVDDSRRLAGDEVRLAKIEMRENVHEATRGGIWLGIAFGAGVVALIGLTVLLTALLGGLLGNLWAGALVTAVLWLGSGYLLITRGLAQIKEQSFTLPVTRETTKETAQWVRTAREPEVVRVVRDRASQGREVAGALTGSSQDLQAVVDRLRAEDRRAD